MRGAVLVFACVVGFLLTGGSPADNPAFTSTYTEWSGENCKSFDSEVDGADGWSVCEGIGDYRLQIWYNFYGHEMISVESQNLSFSTSLTSPQCAASQFYGTKIEWRLADGEPFACIVRLTCLHEDETSGDLVVDGEYLVVKGLDGHEDIEFEINAGTEPDANQKARELADAYF